LALVVWFYTSFGYTEIKFGSFLKKILPTSDIQRRGGFYSKGAKPTIDPKKSGISGIKLIEHAISDIQVTIRDTKLVKPDIFIFSDDTDCKISLENGVYIYHDQEYKKKLEELVETYKKFLPYTKIVFLFASSEIETWFLADSSNTFEKSYPHINPFIHQLNTYCDNKVFPINQLEHFSHYDEENSSCSVKISEHCVQNFIKDSSNNDYRYSKRIQGQEFMTLLDPKNLLNLTDFFKPAYDAIINNRDFIPITK
jgi:hypothetical protein